MLSLVGISRASRCLRRALVRSHGSDLRTNLAPDSVHEPSSEKADTVQSGSAGLLVQKSAGSAAILILIAGNRSPSG